MMECIGFRVTLGVNPGYGHGNGSVIDRHSVALLWQNLLGMQGKNDIVVSAVISDTITVYPVENGCPLGGETTVTITGSPHPMKHYDEESYRQAVRAIAARMQRILHQTTMRLEFYRLEMEYFGTSTIR